MREFLYRNDADDRLLALLPTCLENRDVIVFEETGENQDTGVKRVFYHELPDELKAMAKLVVVNTNESRFFDRADRKISLHTPGENSIVQSIVSQRSV